MATDTILLSICIPTFNRSSVLRETLDSITSQDVFTETGEVELIVSDNASTDDTPLVVAEFAQRFPGRVVFHRQPVNVWTANFHQALSLGRGQYLKLHNDTLLVREGALGPLLDVIRQLVISRPVMFMTNGNRLKAGNNLLEHCNTLDEFIQQASFFSTWMGGFGLWREDLALAKGFLNDTNHLVQTEIVCKQISEGRPAVVFFGNYYLSKQDFRGTYNWAEVFGKNYLAVLKKHVTEGQLSVATFEQAKQEVLLRHILPTYFNTKNALTKTGFFENLIDYRDDAYFYQAIADKLPLLWRLSNPHNRIELRSVSSPALLARVSVGKRSRGALVVSGPSEGSSSLEIGHCVSIGEGVTFIVGETPPPGSTFSNYWSAASATALGSIKVADDVWIGSGSVLHSGITVGQGAIIAAGSVVIGDVPPYSQVSGNPAQLVAYRFEQAVIDKLRTVDFSTLTDKVIATAGTALLAPINGENVDAFLHLLEAAGMPSVPVSPASTPEPQPVPRVPAVLILDGEGEVGKVEESLSALAEGPCAALPVIVLTTQGGDLPEWTDSLRYVQTSAHEFAEAIAQLRALPDFEWVSIVEAGQ